MLVVTGALHAREHHLSSISRPLAANIIVPQSRAFVTAQPAGVIVTQVQAGVVILEQHAETTLDISLRNPTGSRQEAEVLFPVPEGAVVKAFDFQGAGAEPSARLLPADEARSTYNAIVAKVRDPAILEFAGNHLIRSSVFPVEANGTQKLRLTYEHLLTADGSRIDYVLPRSESVEYNVPWDISVRIMAKRPLSTLYSPSHKLDVSPIKALLSDKKNVPGGYTVTAKLAAGAQREPGPFRLSYIHCDDSAANGGRAIGASLFAYPDPKIGGGYFLLVAGAPVREAASPMKREVTLVIDRSGSMNGEKLEQVREAALQVIAGLDEGEAFNVILYNESVEKFSNEPVVKNKETEASARAYLKGMTARGGTNIHDALLEALQQKPVASTLPIVLFLTDGLPTVGQTAEVTIRELASKANPHQRRVFTFGVGVDVNTPLLDKIASTTRATTAVVLPKENVEVKVGGVFKRLAGPVLARPVLEAVNESGARIPGRVRDVIPSALPDLFENDQLVVIGQYVGDAPLNFKLSGQGAGGTREFAFSFPLDKATTRNAFVPRLWASRKIAMLVDAIREAGADKNTIAAHASRTKELVDEVVRLSKDFGVLTEYTAFLALEGTDLTKPDEVSAVANGNFHKRAYGSRSGMGSWNQEFNKQEQAEQKCMNYGNGYLDEKMNRVSVSSVQQVSDRTFYRRDNRWIDSRVLGGEEKNAPAKVVTVGSEEFRKLAEKLSGEGRQGCIALKGEVLLQVDGETVLVK